MNIDQAIERVRELSGNTHILFDEQGARYYTEPFDFKPTLYRYDANPRDPKGLTLNNGAKWAMGLASWDLAFQIYRHFQLSDAEGKLGRGSQQREYCNSVIRHLEKMREHV